MKISYLANKLDRLNTDFSIYGVDALNTILMNNVVLMDEMKLALNNTHDMSQSEMLNIKKLLYKIGTQMRYLDDIKETIDTLVKFFTSIHFNQSKIKEILDNHKKD